MTTCKEKAAWVLDTPKAASVTLRGASLSVSAEKPSSGPSATELAAARANFASLGHSLACIKRAPDWRVRYVVTQQRRKAYRLTHWHDVQALLASLGVSA